ncbi:glycosyltransferase [Geodermatophilus ruber]|uniref:Glycosyl transferases group 1 n=1 Tax=Geodermatophilus ruber TaxID=504800 RepID=A0A1I4EIY2_9ACTN|nr:glycosyltransferase [Geodermatophilus ruber]SFL05173.1 Glycosyl transferases group 1 [Geodermatophilus ruber]
MATRAPAPAGRPLVCVSRLVPAGGVDILLTAFGLLVDDRPGLALEIVGGGPLGRVLRRTAEEMGLAERVHFRGPQPWPAVRAVVQRSAMLVLPHRADVAGSNDHDGQGALLPVLRHALACARPVVATRAVAPHVLRHGETGLLVPPEDPVALALAVAGLLDDPDRAAALSSAGRQAVAGLPDGDPGGGRLQWLWQRVTG